MKPFKIKEGTHFVIKKEDTMQYLNPLEKVALRGIISSIASGRLDNGKKLNEYLVVNTDEPYADEIREVIKRGELAKGE